MSAIRNIVRGLLLPVGVAVAIWAPAAPAQDAAALPDSSGPVVVMETSLGEIHIRLFATLAPLSVANFLSLVDAHYYENTCFHRVLPELIQGGGYTVELERKPRGEEITNEAPFTPSNRRGAVAMVHQPGRPHSATAEFFINVADNTYLDHQNKTPGGYGWAVFGQVTAGMDVVDTIAAVPSGARGPFVRDCPLETVAIVDIRRSAP